MKKIFVLIAFLFAVVCYAAPPPDLLPVPDPVTDQCGYVVQDNVNISFVALNAPKVAFIDIGNRLTTPDNTTLFAVTNQFLMLPEVICSEGVIMNGMFNCINNGHSPNKQNSNYGYPFGADYVS